MSLIRRSNEERSNQTRSNILEATVRCIHQHGYQGATMSLIAQESGVTRGALQHHFGNRRIELIAQAAEHVYDQYFAQYLPILQDHEPDKLLHDVWQLQKELFHQKETIVLIQIWLACRSDEELSERILPLFKELDAKLSEQWRVCLKHSGLEHSQIQTIRYLQRTLLRGAAIEYLMFSDKSVFENLFDIAEKATQEIINKP
ncbi:TetR/AcrR family transcriptional regulator [Pseudoteredinibacter isoporae]|uniref:AcrR family transcriptional regulator n=1 Tax=Pseudoteredinibacter isoporae TaxID=570281 RepID=A0A7X0JP91_9GAMM|nr:TetR/AcrR family transcriptional regulator [Pseudoteredinibacter isoporae]MBB6519770.1 AcrR family transcriptional regulator [Pseudoteredinibacter isoporae]NHO85351.1 TetR/AcrR family transcriptional regulator [Pseudoteredinibacter isoporae]NIB26197.1 TetR/AcrR family transcriptional regulator [Pseudoteredinibacter isoporae]